MNCERRAFYWRYCYGCLSILCTRRRRRTIHIARRSPPNLNIPQFFASFFHGTLVLLDMRFNMSNPLVRSSKAALTNGANVGLLFRVTSRMRPQMILARKSPRAIRAGKGARVCVDALVAFTLVGSSEALWAVLALVCSIGDWDL